MLSGEHGLEALRCLVLPRVADQLLYDRRHGRGESYAKAHDLATLGECLEKLWLDGQGRLALLLGDKDVNVLFVRRHCDKDLAADSERRVLEVRLLGHLGQ